jgi:hypothetical protein
MFQQESTDSDSAYGSKCYFSQAVATLLTFMNSTTTRKRLRDSLISHHFQTDGDSDRPRKTNKIDGASETNLIPSLATDEPQVEIESLLDFTSLTSASAIPSRFDAIADALFFHYQLLLTCGHVQTAFEVLELEFYLRKSGCHEDPFTHGSEEQKQSGQWFVSHFLSFLLSISPPPYTVFVLFTRF